VLAFMPQLSELLLIDLSPCYSSNQPLRFSWLSPACDVSLCRMGFGNGSVLHVFLCFPAYFQLSTAPGHATCPSGNCGVWEHVFAGRLLHCALAAVQGIVICPVCLCVGGSVTMITQNCVHRSSPNWVCR